MLKNEGKHKMLTYKMVFIIKFFKTCSNNFLGPFLDGHITLTY